MKLTATTLAGLLFLSAMKAQLVPVKNSFQSDLAKVIGDYPAHFKNLAGEHIVGNPQAAEYACMQSVQEALTCKVIKHSSVTKEIFSWQAEMLHTEDFEEAAKKFQLLYNSIQNLTVDADGSFAVMKGSYVQPAESMKFTSVVFKPGEKKSAFKNLKVELLMEAEMLEWVVKVLVYEKEREDNERGSIKDE